MPPDEYILVNKQSLPDMQPIITTDIINLMIF